MGTQGEGPKSKKGDARNANREPRLIESVRQDLIDEKYGIGKEPRVIPGNEPPARGKKPPRPIPDSGADSFAKFDPIPPPETEADASERLTQSVRDYNRQRDARGDDR